MNTVSSSRATRALGATNLKVSPMAWGMWRFRGDDLAGARERVEAALEAGLTLFDTADIYGPDNGEPFGAAEALLGRVLAEAPHLRERMALATKAGIEMGVPYNSSADYLVGACEASLKRMGVERVELFQIHRPDLLAHPAEVAGALERLREAGKIAEAGVSNHTASQTAALMAHLTFPLASIQPEFSAAAVSPLSDGVLDQAMEAGLAVLAWSPLGGGRLMTGDTPAARALQALASEKRVSREAVAYAWIMAHPSKPIPIVGSQRPERIAAAIEALDVELTRAEWYQVLVAARGEPMP